MRLALLQLAATALLLCANPAPGQLSLEVMNYKVDSPSAHAFFIKRNPDDLADLALIDGQALTLYDDLAPQPTLSIALPETVSAIDIADVDNDGIAELIAFSKRDVLLYRLETTDELAEPQLLFQLDSPVVTRQIAPFPQVIVIDYEGAKAIAVPKPRGIDLYDLHGAQLARFPIVNDSPTPATGKSFDAWQVHPTQSAPPGALELRLRLYTRETPKGIAVAQTEAIPISRGTVLQANQALEKETSQWPWFPLNNALEESPRVHFAFAGPKQRSTLLSMRSLRTAAHNSAQRPYVFGPKRRYPGILIIPRDAAPDFNADGNADLLLWNTRLPGRSLGELTRAAERMTWPVTLTIHLYSPTNGIYNARPQWRAETQVPIPNILYLEEGSPLKHLTLRDIDADGRTDILYSRAPSEITLWMPALTNAKPKSAPLPSPITQIQQSIPDQGDGQPAILLRTKTGFSLVQIKIPSK